MVTIAVLALVHAGVVAKVGGWTVRGDSSFVDSGDRRGVVSTVGQCGITYVMVGGHDVDLSKQSRMFKVTISDSTSRVCLGHKVLLDVLGKWAAPKVALPLRVIVHPSHAGLGGVSGS